MFQFHVCIFHYFICTFALVAIRTQGQSLLLREEPKVHSELLKEDEGEDGLRAETRRAVGDPSLGCFVQLLD